MGSSAHTPGASHGRLSLVEELKLRTGRNPAKCYQCGKCSAGCPLAVDTRHRPHDVLRLVCQNRREELWSSKSIWLCAGCETCTARCPNDCDPAGVIDALREMVLESRPGGVPKEVGAFHQAFLNQIRSRGRVSELAFMTSYKVRSGELFQDAAAGPPMVARGKLRPPEKPIGGAANVRRIFAACEAAGKEVR